MLNLQIRIPYRPIDAKISALSTDRDKLPSGKQILALTLTWAIIIPLSVSFIFHRLDGLFLLFWFFRYKVKLEDGAEVKPQIPFLNDRIYDTKFESQFYMISDSNKVFWLYFFPSQICWDIGKLCFIDSLLFCLFLLF